MPQRAPGRLLNLERLDISRVEEFDLRLVLLVAARHQVLAQITHQTERIEGLAKRNRMQLINPRGRLTQVGGSRGRIERAQDGKQRPLNLAEVLVRLGLEPRKCDRLCRE